MWPFSAVLFFHFSRDEYSVANNERKEHVMRNALEKNGE